MIKSWLKVRMAERDLTIEKLSKQSGVNTKTLSCFRNNRLSRFDGSVLERLCGALNCQVGDLLEYIPDTQSKKPQNLGKKARK